MQKHDGKNKRRIICAHMQWNNYALELWDMYHNKHMSGQEIADTIGHNIPKDLGLTITARSIQRTIATFGKAQGHTQPLRSPKEAFNLAIKRGRVQWVYKDTKYKRTKLNTKLRYSVLQRDGFACVLCGNTAQHALLEVDHILPVCRGGLSTLENLRTLCHLCNKGKQINDNER